jgi:hypothetical protein
MTSSKVIAQQYFDDMRSITLDSQDARDCATIMVKELKMIRPDQTELWDAVIKDLKTTEKGLKVRK